MMICVLVEDAQATLKLFVGWIAVVVAAMSGTMASLVTFFSVKVSAFWISWALSQENLTVACEQKLRKPACASTQSDHRLSYLLFGK